MAFTSDLSIDEVLLIEDCGFEPVDMVMGTSFYHTGIQTSSWGQNMELTDMTQLMYQARNAAMRGMLDQAKELGADGIVGVDVEFEREQDHINFLVIGTAIKRRDGQGASWRVGSYPFCCDLRGEDFWTLLRAGYRPRLLVMGNCVYHIAHQMFGSWKRSFSSKNMEIDIYTQALYDARELAMERLEQEAQRSGATGVVGMQVSEGSHSWGNHILEFFAIGTSVVPLEGVDIKTIPSPLLMVRATDD